MYFFTQSYKAEVLQGRTIKYLAEKKLNITKEYLSQILNGKKGCSLRLANDITKCICLSAQVSDYFENKGE